MDKETALATLGGVVASASVYSSTLLMGEEICDFLRGRPDVVGALDICVPFQVSDGTADQCWSEAASEHPERSIEYIRIAAVKHYRLLSGCGLRDAVIAVNAAIQRAS